MELLSSSQIKRVLRCPNLQRTTLAKAEDLGRIPKANRVKHGTIDARKWKLSDLPQIGKKYGKYPSPNKQQVISFYTGKGGVLKSTLAFNFSRTLAFSGIKTLLIGLDIQESVTTLALGDREYQDLENINKDTDSLLGLYSFFKEEIPLEGIIQSTNLPTLDVLPETFELNLLEKDLRNRTRRESTFKDKLLPHLGKYEVIIFDNSPNWNLLIENSLVASNIILAPISCTVGTYQTLNKNLNALIEFKTDMRISWDDYIMIPTLLDNTKISKQILGSYLITHKERVTTSTIRRAVKGEESMALKQSIFEYSPKSLIADDYDALFVELWEKINRKIQ